MKVNTEALLKECKERYPGGCAECKHFLKVTGRCIYRIVFLDFEADFDSGFLKCVHPRLLAGILLNNENDWLVDKNIVVLDVVRCRTSCGFHLCDVVTEKHGNYNYCEKHHSFYFQHKAFRYKALCCHCYTKLKEELRTKKLFTIMRAERH